MNISVLGCGWLGFPLGKELLTEGYSVKGSTTQPEKMVRIAAEGITPYLIQILDEGVQGDLASFLRDTEVLIINIPPGSRNNHRSNFARKIEWLKGFIEKSPVEHVLFVSSTSVYEDSEMFPEYTEIDPANGTQRNSLEIRGVENILKISEYFTLSILRFGGLFGPGRHPVNYLAGKKNIPNPLAPVNLIHQKDCIGIILAIIEKKVWGEVFNAVYPQHPTREEYYKLKATQRNLAVPEFEKEVVSIGKIIISSKVEEKLGYVYKEGI